MSDETTAEDEWHDFLAGTHPHLQHKSPLRFIPSSPRCKLCKVPFGAPGRLIFGRYGFSPWAKNPKICGRCFKAIRELANGCPSAFDNDQIAGAEVEISMLFADVRGSSEIARRMPVIEFTKLMNRFYRVTSDVLIEHDAIIEKFVGDEIVGLFVPFLASGEHARRAISAAKDLLHSTGHGSPEGPWAPVGVGVHTGTAFVGIVASTEGVSDFTALGDPMNIAAHLASQAGPGEILVTMDAAAAAAIPDRDLERRNLSLKGHPVDAMVLRTSPVEAAG
jgi:adenylate cyclase